MPPKNRNSGAARANKRFREAFNGESSVATPVAATGPLVTAHSHSGILSVRLLATSEVEPTSDDEDAYGYVFVDATGTQTPGRIPLDTFAKLQEARTLVSMSALSDDQEAVIQEFVSQGYTEEELLGEAVQWVPLIAGPTKTAKTKIAAMFSSIDSIDVLRAEATRIVKLCLSEIDRLRHVALMDLPFGDGTPQQTPTPTTTEHSQGTTVEVQQLDAKALRKAELQAKLLAVRQHIIASSPVPADAKARATLEDKIMRALKPLKDEAYRVNVAETRVQEKQARAKEEEQEKEQAKATEKIKTDCVSIVEKVNWDLITEPFPAEQKYRLSTDLKVFVCCLVEWSKTKDLKAKIARILNIDPRTITGWIQSLQEPVTANT